MNKTELIEVITKVNNLSKKENEGTLKAFVYTISREIQRGGKVQLVRVGSFEVGKRAARTGRNPQIDAEIKIKSSKTSTFKAGKELKNVVNKK